jgi:hypothetical protein
MQQQFKHVNMMFGDIVNQMDIQDAMIVNLQDGQSKMDNPKGSSML